MSFKTACTEFIEFFFAPRCVACGVLLSPHRQRTNVFDSFCHLCVESLISLSSPRCTQCAEPFAAGTVSHRCGVCLAHPPAFDTVCSPFEYGGALADALHRFKYCNAPALAPCLAKLMLPQEIPRVDLVIPVPLHSTRLKERGFNQSALLAQCIAQEINRPYRPLLLRREKQAAAQVGKSKKERINNMKDAFVSVDMRHQIASCRVLLVDDVVTTTATVRAAAFALKKFGQAATVQVLCLGRASTTI